MSTLEEKLAKLRAFNASVHETDEQLAEESADLRGALTAPALERTEAAGRRAPAAEEDTELAVVAESIALRRTRPVLAIRDHQPVLDFRDAADSAIWKARLTAAAPVLDAAIRAVGRIDLEGGSLDWVGTGWLVSENILVTNRHVARWFAERKGSGFVFSMGDNGTIRSTVDFLQEIDNPATLTFRLVKPLHIEEAAGADVAFFEVERSGGGSALGTPIPLAARVAATEHVATIGYPAYDSRIPEPELMERIYGSVYNKKRLAPGAITRVDETRAHHNCTTLGGNSGSVVLDLKSGEALALHFSGTFLAINYAVRADVLKRLLSRVRSGKTRPEFPSKSTPRTVPVRSAGNASAATATWTIPLTVTVALGKADVRAYAPRIRAHATSAEPEESEDDTDEAVPADYRNRRGYIAGFLGDGFEVPLPVVERNANDVLEYELDGETRAVLPYEHFSVVMSRSRRMCILSAVNIDGNLSKKSARVEWKFDPRIPKAQQIKNECYGNPPKFSRGHMTRREDPGWGRSPAVAKRGNQDSMHVTNAAPQMQAFNAPIWLALEDYALQHAREDAMKISVYTGPYFKRDDPVHDGVAIPVAFWKVIAFIHDDTGELCATGYEMSQEQSLPPPADEFVFGAFTSPQLSVATQVSIRSIAQRSGLSFGLLADVDPLAEDEESVGDSAPLLQTLEQIRFVR
jgi:endonuclease G, mitochondrial